METLCWYKLYTVCVCVVWICPSFIALAWCNVLMLHTKNNKDLPKGASPHYVKPRVKKRLCSKSIDQTKSVSLNTDTGSSLVNHMLVNHLSHCNYLVYVWPMLISAATVRCVLGFYSSEHKSSSCHDEYREKWFLWYENTDYSLSAADDLRKTHVAIQVPV